MLSANIANYLRGIAALSASSVLSVNSVLEHFGSCTKGPHDLPSLQG
jgi:hypothetical protein